MGHKNVVRINSDEKNVIRFNISNNDCVLNIDDSDINLNDVTAVWYRKGGNWFGQQFKEIRVNNYPDLSDYLNRVSANENKVLNDYVHYLIKQKSRVLGSAFKSGLNKLMTLEQAKSVGLLVPEFNVMSELSEVRKKLNSNTKYITKSMSDGIYFFDSKVSETAYFTYTEDLTESRLEGLPAYISPSFAQSKINKKYEVRTFYLDGKFYSWAILSQKDSKTKTDYRKYNNAKPNRNLSIKLPNDIQQKLEKLFKRIGLNTGSIDLMVDHNGHHYFLEINPVGQFGYQSKLSNYLLEKQVANWLLNNE